MRHFGLSLLVTVLCLGAAYAWAGLFGLLITAILGVMEVSLSFDNAVVNAAVLRRWSAFWQTLFLTLGILVAVFGMRLLFPLLIVAQATDLGMIAVWRLAIDHPAEYAHHLLAHYPAVAAFGGSFLLLVFLNFLFDDEKELHWLGWPEKKLGALGKVNAVAVLVALGMLLFLLEFVQPAQQLAVLTAGIWGIVVYLAVNVISHMLAAEEDDPAVSQVIKQGGIGGFLYLEVLDASFSFDGVIGAFAVSKDVVIIMLGLGIGAMFVRSLTVFLVRQGTLTQYVFLEHGAHYAIGMLALIMLASVQFHIPEVVTGLIGVGFIIASLWSSIRYNRTRAPSR